MNGERGLLKGNRDHLSSESINEVITSKLHEMQGFKNHTEYKLIKIYGRDYDYGCFSKLFTPQELELISAYDVVCFEKKSNDQSYFEHFIQACAKHGLDEQILRSYLDYMILSDFVLSGRDRHLSKVSILRDAETLQFVMPAPIYDSGKCLFVEEIYGLDSQIDEKRISLIGEGYERKIDLFRAFQLGEDLHKIKLAVRDYRNRQ